VARTAEASTILQPAASDMHPIRVPWRNKTEKRGEIALRLTGLVTSELTQQLRHAEIETNGLLVLMQPGLSKVISSNSNISLHRKLAVCALLSSPKVMLANIGIPLWHSSVGNTKRSQKMGLQMPNRCRVKEEMSSIQCNLELS
jgi:hypothetical protein